MSAPHPTRQGRLVVMSIASFLLYALGVLTLHQDRSPGWIIEAGGPFPAAVSHLVYGTPLGALDDNVLRRFSQSIVAHDVQGTIAIAAEGSIPRGKVYMYSFDGNGAGSNLFATIAMWMFGINISSLILFYLVFVGVSAFAFVLRYQDTRLIALPLYFLVVTVMLLTPLSTSPDGVDQIAIGGIRYFTLATFLPALHIFFELVEGADAAGYKAKILNSLLLLIQEILLLAALLVRSSTSYVLGVLLAVLIWRLFRDRRNRNQFIPLAYKIAIIGAAFAFWAVFVVTALPAYVQTGRVFGVFWHRAFISFSLHPDWPFGNLREIYNCTKYIPEGLSKEANDRNGHCVWLVYPPNATRPMDEVVRGVLGGEYERALRSAYFYVLTHYPREVFELYFYTKSKLIKDTLTQAWNYLFQLSQAPVAKGLFVIVCGATGTFISFIISTGRTALLVVDRRMTIFPILFIFSLAPRYVAWSSWTTAADMIFLMYCCLVLAALLLVQSLTRTVASGALMLPAGLLKKVHARCCAWSIHGPQ